MAKDLEFTAKVAADLSKSARADESLKKLIDAWNSKNAKSAKRVGTFGFMAASLAACGSDGVTLPSDGTAGALSAFRFLAGPESDLVIQSLDADPDTAANDVLDVSDLLGAPDAAFDASAGVVIPAGETYVGDISLVDGGIAVSGDGNLWLLAPAADFTGNSQTVALDIDLNGGTLTFDMESDADTIIIDAAQSSIDLNGGTLQISDGTVLVSAAEYATWNVGDLIVNSTLEVDFRDANFTDAEISSLVSALDAATEAGNTASAVRFLVKDDAQATLVFEALEENTALAGGAAPKVEVKGVDGTSVTVNLDAIIDSKLEFLTESLEKQIDEINSNTDGTSLNSISELKAAVEALNALAGSSSVSTQIIDAIGVQSDTTVNPTVEATGLWAGIETAIASVASDLQVQIDEINSNTDGTSLNSISELKAAVEALNALAGSSSVSTQIIDAIGVQSDTTVNPTVEATGLWAGIETAIASVASDLQVQIDEINSNTDGTSLNSISELKAAVEALNALAGSSSVSTQIIDAIGVQSDTTANPTVEATGLWAGIETAIASVASDLQVQIDEINSNTDGTSLNSISELKAAVEALQTATGTNTGSTSLDSRVGDLEASLNTLITEIFAGPGFALTVAEASDLPGQPLGEALIANYRIVDTAENILAATSLAVLGDAKAIILAGGSASGDPQVVDADLASAIVPGDSALDTLGEVIVGLSSRGVDWAGSSYSIAGNAAELVGLAPVVLNGATDLTVTGDVSAAQANTFMSAQNSGTTTIGSLVVSAAEAAAIQFDANDVVTKVTVTGSHVDNTIDLSHFPLGTEIVFTGRAGGETVILPEGTTGDGVDTYNLAVDLASGKGDDTLVFYGGGDEDTSSDTLVVSGNVAFAGGENTLTLVGSVDFSQVAVTSTIIRFSEVAADITADDTFTFTFAGDEYVATVGATADTTATADEVQAAIDGAVLTSDNAIQLGSGKIAVSFETGDTSNLLFTSLDADNPFPTAGRFTNVDGQGATTFGFGNFSVSAFTGSASAVTISPETVSLISGFAGDGTTTFEVKNTAGAGREVVDLSNIDLGGVDEIVVGNNVTAAVSLEQAAKTTLIKTAETEAGGDGGKLVAKLQGTLDVDLDLTGSDFDEILPATGEVDGDTLFLTDGVTLENDAMLTMPATVASSFSTSFTSVKIKGYGEDENADLSGIADVTFLTDVALDVPSGKKLTLTPAQANGLIAGGEGVVNIDTSYLTAPATIDLTGISAGIEFDGETSATIAENVTLVLTETQLMASTVIDANNAGAVLRITEVTGTKDITGKIDVQPGSVIAELIDEDISGVSSSEFGAVTEFDIAEGRTLTLTAAQADGKATTSAGATVIVTDGVADTPYAFADLVPTGSGSTTITYASGTTLNAATTFAPGQFVNVTAAMVDSLSPVELNKVEQVTIFDLGGSSGAILQGITADMAFDIEASDVVTKAAFELKNGQTLTVKSEADAEQTLDMTGSYIVSDGTGVINVTADTVLRIDAKEAADQLEITGEGSVRVPYDSSNNDFSTIKTTDGLAIEFGNNSGADNVIAADATFPTDIPVSFVTEDSSATVDLTAVTQPLSNNITVDENVTLKATAAQLDGVDLSGLGSVEVLDLHLTPDADLSGVTAGSVSIYGTFANSATFDGTLSNSDANPQNVVLLRDANPVDLTLGDTADIGTATFDVGADVTLIGTGAKLDGTTVTGAGAVTVNDVAAGHDLSGIGAGVKVEGLNGELSFSNWFEETTQNGNVETSNQDSITLTNSQGDSSGTVSASASITFSTSGVFTFTGLREGDATNRVQVNGQYRYPQDVEDNRLDVISEEETEYSLAVEAGDVLSFSLRGPSYNDPGLTEVTLDGLSFTPDGSPLDVTASIDTTQDISASTDFATVDSYVLSNDAKLTLTLEQASGVEITGTGSVNLVGTSLSRSMDLTKIDVEVTFVYDENDQTPDEISVSSRGANILLTTEQADGLALVGENGLSTYYNTSNTLVVIFGDVAADTELDLSGIQDVQLGFDNDAGDLYSADGSIDVAENATLVLHASTLPDQSDTSSELYQATGNSAATGDRWENSITGVAGGTVRIAGDFGDDYRANIQLRHISPDLTLEFAENSFDFGTGILYIDAAHIDGQTINAGGADAEIHVYGSKDGIDLSNIGLSNTETLTIDLLSYNGTPILTGAALPNDPINDGNLLRDGMELYLDASQVAAAEIDNAPVSFATEGTVRVRMGANADTAVDLSGITAPTDQLIAEVAGNVELVSSLDLGEVVVDIVNYYTVAATLDQFDGAKVIGSKDGTLSFVGTTTPTTANGTSFDLTQIASDIDFSGLTATFRNISGATENSYVFTKADTNDNDKVKLYVGDPNDMTNAKLVNLPTLAEDQDVYISAEQLAAGGIPEFSFDEANSNSVLYVTGDLSSGTLDLRDLKGFSEVAFRDHWSYSTGPSGTTEAGIDIADGAEILLTTAQISQITSSGAPLADFITGAGDVSIVHDGSGDVVVDLSGVDMVSVGDNETDVLAARAKDVSGLTIDGQGSLKVIELDEGLNADLSQVDLPEVEFDLATQAGSAATINFAGNFGTNIPKLTVSGSNKTLDITGVTTNLPTEISVDAGAGLVLTAAQADNLSITGAGNVDVVDLGTTAVDLSGITVTGTQEVFLAEGDASVILDLNTNLGTTEVVLIKSDTVSQTVTFTDVAQASGRTVVTLGDPESTGKTKVVLDIGSGNPNVGNYAVDVLSVTNGGLALFELDPANVPTLEVGELSYPSLDVDSANTLEVIGAGDVDISLTAASIPDFDFSKVAPDKGVILYVYDDQVLDSTAKIGTADLTVSGNGKTLDVSALDAGNWGITSAERVQIFPTAALKLRADQATGRDISGSGSVVVTDIDGTLDVNLANVVPGGGVTIELSTDTVLTNTAVFGQADLIVTGAHALDVTNVVVDSDPALNNWGITAAETITVDADSTLKLTAAQADGLAITGAGQVVVTDIDSTSDADLSGVIPDGGVTIDLTADAVLTSGARFGEGDLTVTGGFELDLDRLSSWSPTTTDMGTVTVVEMGTTLRLPSFYADEIAIEGAGNVTVEEFYDINANELELGQLDLSDVTVTGIITLERGLTDDSEKYEVDLAGTDVDYVLNGSAAGAGDFILKVAGPDATGSATIDGFATGSTPDAFDQLDFSEFTNVTGAPVFLSKASSPTIGNDLVIFQSGSAGSAKSIEAAFNVSTDSDFVGNGSVNDQIAADAEMIFGVRTQDQTGNDLVNFWHWDDADSSGGDGDGEVDASEMTLFATLDETLVTNLTGDNFILASSDGFTQVG